MARPWNTPSFQFLIGTIKRTSSKEESKPFPEFQFLIGTIKSVYLINVNEFPEAFQFLIGTIKSAAAAAALAGIGNFNSS